MKMKNLILFETMSTKSHQTFFIPGNVPSLKNTKQVAMTRDKNPNKRRAIMFNHPRVKEYLQLTDDIYEDKAPMFYAGYQNGHDLLGEPEYAYPVKVGFHFIRADMRDFDFHNALHVVADQMTKHQWIPDDCMKYFLPAPLYLTPKKFTYTTSWYSVYPDRPGVAIRIIGGQKQ